MEVRSFTQKRSGKGHDGGQPMKYRAFVLLPCALILLTGRAIAGIWSVMPDSTGNVINIQAGIDSCVAGDTVLVAPGIYKGDGNWDLDFKGKPIVVMSMSRFDVSVTDATIIDCKDIESHRGFHFHCGETPSSILEGFEIINGGEASPDWECGGAILCESSSPTIRFNVISHCAAMDGGGIAMRSSCAIIRDNHISRCRVAGSGGGLFCQEGSPTIENNRIFGNDSGGGGGIMLWSCSDMRVSGNDIEGNYSASDYMRNADYIVLPTAFPPTMFAPAATEGGGIWAIASSGLIEYNNIVENGGGITAEYSNLAIVGNAIGNNHACGVMCRASAVFIDNNDIYGNDGACFSPGGIALGQSGHSTIRNNRIFDNHSDQYAGGIYYNGDSTSAITDNLIVGNSGGIVCHSSILISGNHIKQNTGSPFVPGAGITCESGSPRIAYNLIERNRGAGMLSGGIYCRGGHPAIEQNTIVNNEGYAAIYCDAGATASIRNSIIASNTCSDPCEASCGIYSESSNIVVACSDVFNNGGNEYAGIPDQTGINGNFSADPLFCSADEYFLHVLSPCNAGNHPYGSNCGSIGALGVGCDYVTTFLLDYSTSVDRSIVTVSWSVSDYREMDTFSIQRAKGTARHYADIPEASILGDGTSFSFLDERVAPGESYRYRVSVRDETGEQTLFETDLINVPEAPLVLHQNHPNPFNPSTRIEYNLPSNCRVTLNIYDVSGKLVLTLINESQERGEYSLQWDGSDADGNAVSSGVYFYRLTAGKETISRKMIMLR